MRPAPARNIAAVPLLVPAFFHAGCASPVERYLATRSDLTIQMRAAILQQRVIPGMSPDEANAAGGEFVYQVTADKKVWGGNYFPPRVIFAQRLHPDNSVIKLTFSNRAQFQTKDPVPFTVTFRHGRAVSIERDPP
jgi:hypothetical protein